MPAPQRIVIVVPTLPAPSETWVFHHLQMVGRSGFVPLLLVMSAAQPVPAAVANATGAVVFLPDCPRNWAARAIFLVRALAKSGREMPRLARTLNVLLLGRRVKSLLFFRCAIALRELEPFDLVHAHYLFMAEIIGALRRCGFLRAPLMGTVHGVDLNVWPQRQPRSIFPGFLSSVSILTFGSRFMLGQFPVKIIPEPRLELLPLGIDPDRFPELPEPRKTDPLVILTVARLVSFKGLDIGIQAFAQFLKSFPEARYQIAGEGPERSELEALAVKLEIADRVFFLGVQNEAQLTRLYREADIFLFPSLTTSDGAREGQGLSVLEAQAAGLPVVASASGGIPENLLPDRSGFLVAERDVAAFAKRLGELARSREMRFSFGCAGRRFVTTERGLESTRQRFAALYRELLHLEPQPPTHAPTKIHA